MNHNAREVKRLHRIAMEYADEADLAKLFGKRDEYLRLMKMAFEKEKSAADLMADIHVEPSRGVLHRSAATMGWLCGMYVGAEKLIYRALAGNPRSDIEWELKDLLGTVNLAKSGIHLSEAKLQLSLQGSVVGFGKAAEEEVSSRTPSIAAMLRISAKSAFRKAHDEVSNLSKEIGDIPVFYEGLEAGSCIVNLRLGEPIRENALPGFGLFDEAIQPFLDHLSLLEGDQVEELQEDLDNQKDYADFIKAATKLAPDGQKISSVKFQAVVDDFPKVVTLSKSKHYLSKLLLPEIGRTPEATDEDISKKGKLLIASVRETTVVLETADDGDWTVEGGKDLIVQVAQAYLDQRVVVTGKRMRMANRVKRMEIHRFEDVRPADRSDNLQRTEPENRSPFNA